MKTILKILFLSGIIGVMAFSCEKNSQPEFQKSTGLILYYGDPSVDGCGWIIKMDTISYSPINLNTDYQIDSIHVVVKYQILNSTWNCGWREPGYQQIKIIDIKRK